MSYERDRAWSDRFQDDIRSIIGALPSSVIGVTVAPSTLEQDLREATDLVFLYQGGAVACRMYRGEKRRLGLHEITIRTFRGDELAKIRGGFANFYFFGWANDTNDRIAAWCFLDLGVFRGALESGELVHLREKQNNDERKTRFKVYEPQAVRGLVRVSSGPNWEWPSASCLCTRCKGVRALERAS